MKELFVYLFALALSAQVCIAQPKMEFENKVHDFGKIEETAGAVTHRFEFTNSGTEVLIIKKVSASCGCTTPDWSKGPVPPGKKGFVMAKYDPKNRPGTFNKSLTITSNATPNVERVYIKGIVDPRAKTPDIEYPIKMGNLRARYRSLYMGRIKTNEPATKKFDVYNDSDNPIVFKNKATAPDHIKIDFDPTIIPPHSKGYVVVTYDASKKNDFGTVFDHVKLYTTEDKESAKEFRVQATIQEYFPPMTEEELEQAPKLEIENSTYNFGTIEEGEKVTTSFVLKNSGKQPLNIRTTKTTCGCTVADLDKTDLKPGEQVELKVTFDSAHRRGMQHKSISIYSNDPARPTQRVILKGKVSES